MSTSPQRIYARRQLLKFLAASPAFAGVTALSDVFAQNAPQPFPNPFPPLSDAVNVFDFEAVARQRLSRAHWGYLATGVDDELTLKANRDGFARYALRVRRMVDVSAIDTRVKIFGTQYDSPIALAPVSSQSAFYPDGEVVAANAAKSGNHLQILSTLTSTTIESVNAARGGGVWFQLYATDQWDVTTALLKRARDAGSPVLVITVDLNGGSNRETYVRASRGTDRDCRMCHQTDPMANGRFAYKPMFSNIDTSKIRSVTSAAMTWETLKRMRDHWPGKLMIKGIVTREDAELCVRHGVDGIYVSNHGGRAEESGRSTVECLSEVVQGAGRKIPVIMDGGVRRGTDIFKALALGANAVCIGRPYIWGMAAYGQQGADAVLNILRRELAIVMRQAGTRSISEISAAAITT
jgi:4-hydroxymandelate oxidase